MAVCIFIGLVVGAKIALAHELALTEASGRRAEAAPTVTAGSERELPEVLHHLAVVEAGVTGLLCRWGEIETHQKIETNRRSCQGRDSGKGDGGDGGAWGIFEPQLEGSGCTMVGSRGVCGDRRARIGHA